MSGKFSFIKSLILPLAIISIIGYGYNKDRIEYKNPNTSEKFYEINWNSSFEIDRRIINKLEKKLAEFDKILTRDVVGENIPDKFYEINGKKAYLEVDGRTIEQKFKFEKHFNERPYCDSFNLAMYD